MQNSGIVISPPFEVRPAGGFICGGSPSPADLRKYLLYWDKIDYPDNNFISIGPSPDLQFLIDAKVATRTRVQFQGSMPSGNGELFLLAQQAAFEQHQKNSPGVWSLAQLSTSPFFMNTHPSTAIEYEIWNMLPVPQEDVPLNDILEFKAKHHAELVALRAHLDEIYQLVISSSDLPRSKSAQLAKLEVALNDIDKTLDEFGIRKMLTSLRGFISGEFTNIASVGLGAAGVAPLISMPPLAAGLAGAGITFAVRSVLSPSAAKGTHPLTYVSSIKRDLPA